MQKIATQASFKLGAQVLYELYCVIPRYTSTMIPAMASYKFIIRDGRLSVDDEIFELADNTAAYFEAMRIAGRALIDNPSRIARRGNCSLDVSDQSGKLIYNIAISAGEVELDFDTVTLKPKPIS